MSDVQNNLGEVGEILSPCCDEEIQVSDIVDKLKCPLCKTNLKQRAFLPFLEYLMENGHVENLDFFLEYSTKFTWLIYYISEFMHIVIEISFFQRSRCEP